MNRDTSGKTLVVIDCQHDFVDGSLACRGAEEACARLTRFINLLPELRVYYSADDHSPKHMSFVENGGTWPPHCVRGTKGAEIVPVFYTQIGQESRRPGEETLFFKGREDGREEYSAFMAKREDGTVLHEILPEEVIIGGIASEFCVRETCLALNGAGFSVVLAEDCVAYVNREEHERNLQELNNAGVRVIRSDDLIPGN